MQVLLTQASLDEFNSHVDNQLVQSYDELNDYELDALAQVLVSQPSELEFTVQLESQL